MSETDPGAGAPRGALPARTADGAARRAALDATAGEAQATAGLVAYRSEGRLLVIGPGARALPAAERLAEHLPCSVALPRREAAEVAPEALAPPGRVRRIHADVTRVEGWLGSFRVLADLDGEEVVVAPSVLTAGRPFDIVLDLGDVPRIGLEVAPPGYLAPGPDAAALARAEAELPDLVGEFEKPRYFVYDAAVCAHGARGQRGCTRCLDACPSGAIRSLGERIDVDPHLCQGLGVCATACPNGAIAYAFPPARDQLGYLRRLLAGYREAGGAAPVVLFHDAAAGAEWFAAHAVAIPEHVIPCEVEEVGSVGLESWLAVLAWGARVRVLVPPGGVPRSVRAVLDAELAVCAAILAGLSLAPDLVALADAGAEAGPAWPAPSAPPGLVPATFAPLDEKRTVVRLAVDHLRAHAPPGAPAAVALPPGAAYGEVEVERGACTLCMACASVCPSGALLAGGAEPKLAFVEWNCVQCGLCERACPEDAVTLRPRFVLDPERRRERRVLNEDAPFACIACGKPFATTRIIERMRAKLADHWMFRDPAAARRLEMCEDCRVKDALRDRGDVLG